MDNKNLYLKYKNKYTNLKNQIGGGIKNVVSALFFKDTVYLVQENNGQWNLPGGGINKGEDYKTASFREFKEETGGFLLDEWIRNILDNNNKPVIKEYIYKEHTKILLYYLIKTFEKPNIIFKKNKETVDGHWFNIEQLPDKIRFPKSMDKVIEKYKKYKIN
jgi:ADP-ribose pyrophosphatase YjhB (NUDIX family)